MIKTTLVEINPQDVTAQNSGNIGENLLEELKKWYPKKHSNLPGDWNFILAPTPDIHPENLNDTLAYIGGTIENVQSAYIYGMYPQELHACSCPSGALCYTSLNVFYYCSSGLNSQHRPLRPAKNIAYGWLVGYEVALLYLGDETSGDYYWVKIPATLVYSLYHRFELQKADVGMSVENNNIKVSYDLQYQYGPARRVDASIDYSISLNNKQVSNGTIPLFTDTTKPNPEGTNTKSSSVVIPYSFTTPGTYTIQLTLKVVHSRGIEDYTNPNDPLLLKETTTRQFSQQVTVKKSHNNNGNGLLSWLLYGNHKYYVLGALVILYIVHSRGNH